MTAENFIRLQELSREQTALFKQFDKIRDTVEKFCGMPNKVAPQTKIHMENLKNQGLLLLLDLLITESRTNIRKASEIVSFDEILEVGKELQRKENDTDATS